MRRPAASILMLGSLLFLLSLPARADDAFANRDEALKGLSAPDPTQRAEAIARRNMVYISTLPPTGELRTTCDSTSPLASIGRGK